MSLVERVRAALEDWRDVREVPGLGGLVFEWDGDPLVGVVDDELVVRAEGGGWATVTGDIDEWLARSADVVIAECVVRWHGELRAGGLDANQAMLALVRHDPEREQLQRILLDVTRGADRDLAQLAVTCLGHVGRIDREVLPEVLARLEELIDDPVLGGTAEDARGDIEMHTHSFLLWRRHESAWVIFAPPGDAEVARQCALVEEPDVVVVVPHAETVPSLPEYVLGLVREVEERTHTMDEECGLTLSDPAKPGLRFVLEYDGDIAALQPLLNDWEDLVAVVKEHYLLVW
ncbi:hypothetical protein SK854_31405 [Lentzea sp. BCCO 10_0061]|uniref:DUF4253 domain-containing protein n=1 Tax=Lentzea sokolovensis TaxID=3095429 RepID=A0ABU4V6S4_9PSEU|nr:hypothetical protein [Lentzea sp. BCCO 10_0061]MDX8146658.1 hypothetical protein [Lentzea sp. BCCO 10_0061]